ncbi:MAG: ArnT family glycosyltransferase [Candidatus Aenigmatarchaeota archaeon]
MLSKESKYFIIFFTLFSVLIISTSWFGNFSYEILKMPGTSFEINIFCGESVRISLPENWNKKNRLKFENDNAYFFIENMAQDSKKIKVKFRLFPVKNPSTFQFFINNKTLGKYVIHKNSSVTTRIIDLSPGKNTFKIEVMNCEGGCFGVEKKSIDVMSYKEIKEKEFFPSRNWFDKYTHKKIITPSEFHLYNFGENRSYVRLNFKMNSDKEFRDIQIIKGNKTIDSFELDDVYKLYQSPVIEVSRGENILKFSSKNSPVKFNIKDFDIVEISNRKIDLGKGWYPIESWYHETPKRYFNFHWMSNSSTVYLHNFKNKSIFDNIKFEISSYYRPRQIEILLNGNRVKEREIEFTLDEGRDEVFLRNIELNPGVNKIKFISNDGCDKPNLLENNNDERCLSFAFYDMKFFANDSEVEDPSTNSGHYQFYFLLFSFLLFISSIAVYLKKSYKTFNLNKKVFLAIILVFFFSLTLRISRPQTYQLYLDEAWNVEVAENFISNREAELCSYQGTTLKCQEYLKPAAYSFYLSILFSIFGYNLSIIFLNSVFLGSLTCVLVFILGYCITKKLKVSILVSLIFSIIPMHVFWSTTVESYATSFFFVLLSITFLYYYFERGYWETLFISVVVMLFSLPFRPENILMLGLFPPIILLESEDRNFSSLLELRNIFLLCLVFSYILLYSKIFLTSLKYYRSVTKLFLLEISNYISVNFELLAFLLILLMGLSLVWLENKRLSKFLVLWTLLFILPLLFHTGTDRMLIPLGLTFAFVVSIVFDFIVDKFESKKHKKMVFFCVIVLVVLIGIRMPIGYENTQAKILQTEVISHLENDIPDGCYIITEHPTLLALGSHKVISTRYALENQEDIEDLASRKCVLFFEGIGCELKIKKDGWFDNCNEFLKKFDVRKYKEYEKENISYNFYRIDDKD